MHLERAAVRHRSSAVSISGRWNYGAGSTRQRLLDEKDRPVRRSCYRISLHANVQRSIGEMNALVRLYPPFLLRLWAPVRKLRNSPLPIPSPLPSCKTMARLCLLTQHLIFSFGQADNDV